MARKDHPFFPHHVLEQVIQFLLLVVILLGLAGLAPAGLEDKADPLNTPEHVKPEWYFLAQYQLLKVVPRAVGIVGMMLAALFIVIFPLVVDRDPAKRRPLARPLFFFGGVVFVVLYVVFTIWGKFS